MIRLKVTHPRVLYQLTFAISASAKRDAAGRRPKRKIFSEEGLRIGQLDDPRNRVEIPITEGGFPLEFASGLGVEEMRQARFSIARVRVAIFCEIVSVCITRSEFDDAERYLNDLISFIRAVDILESHRLLWNEFASRITLLHAHLAHALDRSSIALECYRAAAYLEDEESVIHGMARAGEIVLRIGLFRRRNVVPVKEEQQQTPSSSSTLPALESTEEYQALFTAASEIVQRCLQGVWGDGMVVVGRLIATSLTDEVVRAKQNLKSALDLSCRSRDNYLRLIVLIFSASQYVDTSLEYANKILESTRQLASSLGAVSGGGQQEQADGGNVETPTRRPTRTGSGMQTKEGVKQYQVGNARAGLWIGQRFAEVYKRSNDGARMAKQNALNTVFEKAIEAVDRKADGYLALQYVEGGQEVKKVVPPPLVIQQPPQQQQQEPLQLSTLQTQPDRQQPEFQQQQSPTAATTPTTTMTGSTTPIVQMSPTRTLRHTRMLRGSTISTMDPFSPVETCAHAFHDEAGEEEEEEESVEEDSQVTGPPSTAATRSTNGSQRQIQSHSRSQSYFSQSQSPSRRSPTRARSQRSGSTMSRRSTRSSSVKGGSQKAVAVVADEEEEEDDEDAEGEDDDGEWEEDD
ncbi:hypothetical protein FRC17_006246 [Serendipita sp. 399]|nr:hypothetical protein FRC17_006246 [Serendipita sp. 399]